MTANVLIRAIGEDERDAWNPLWAGYLTFYKTSTLAQEISDTAWSRFHDLDEPLFALGGYIDGQLWGSRITCFIVRPGRATDTAILRICTCRKMRAAVGWDAH